MKMIIFGDLHVPYHDNKAVDIVCKVMNMIQPDKVIVIGDSIDFYGLSTFGPAPDRVLKIQDDLDATFKVHQQLNSDAEYIFLVGNHEYRLERYLRKHPEIFALDALELENLLRLDELGWELRQDYKFKDFLVIHGKRWSKHAGWGAKKELEDRFFQTNIIMGHTHKVGCYMATGPRKQIGGWEIGCLCKSMEYNRTPNWQQGFVVVTDGTVEQVLITKNTYFRGQKI